VNLCEKPRDSQQQQQHQLHKKEALSHPFKRELDLLRFALKVFGEAL